jgi:hypothetical protein
MADLLSGQQLLSGRIKKTPPTEVSADRYNWIKLQETEPDLGVSSVNGSLLITTTTGTRSWTDTVIIDTEGNLTVESEVRLGDVTNDDYSRLRHVSGESSGYGFGGITDNYTVLINEEASVAQALFLGDVDSGSEGTLFGISVLNGSGSTPSTGTESWIPRINLSGSGKLTTTNTIEVQNGDLNLATGDIQRNKFNINIVTKTGNNINCKLPLLLQNYLRMDSFTFRDNVGIVYSRSNEAVKILIP